MYEIKEMTPAEVDVLLDSDSEGRNEYSPRGIFYLVGDKVVVGIDNSAGEAFVEEFRNLNDCIGWLKGEFEIDGYPFKEQYESKIGGI